MAKFTLLGGPFNGQRMSVKHYEDVLHIRVPYGWTKTGQVYAVYKKADKRAPSGMPVRFLFVGIVREA